MPIEAKIHYLQVGDCTSSTVALGLSQDQRLMPMLIQPDDNDEYLALPIVDRQGAPLQQRLLTVLEQSYPMLGEGWLSAPVCILMPHQGDISSSSHYALFSSYCESFPALAEHPNCYLFPYGRSSLLLAWRKIETLLKSEQFPEVWVLAIDSDPRLSRASDEGGRGVSGPAEGSVASECVILARFTNSESGLQRNWFSYEVQMKGASNSSAVEALFRRYQQASKKPIYQLYAPFNGNTDLVNEWVNVYGQLSPSVGKQTQVVMTGAVSGELGACSGLYNLLHLYARYQNGDYLYNTLQLEASEQGLRSAALYTWHT